MIITDKQSAIVQSVKEYTLNRWKLGTLHGLSHWERVANNGLILAKETGANPFITQLFAYLHDSCRMDDLEDLEHGIRASYLVKELRETLLAELTEQEYEQLYRACRDHTTILRDGDSTVDTCFDADRLDLVRLWITPDPNRMATDAGKRLAIEHGKNSIQH